MYIDFPILGLISTLIAALNAAMLFLYWRISPCFGGVRWWIAALGVYAVSFMLFSLRLHLKVAEVTILLPNALILTSQTMVLIGICRFRARPFPIKTVVAALTITALAFLPFLYLWPDFMARSMVMAAITSFMHLVIVYALLTPAPTGHELSHWAAAAIYGFLSGVDLIRLTRTISLPWLGETLSLDVVFVGTLIINSLLATPLSAFAFALLMGQRQVINSRQTERDLQQAKLKLAEQHAQRQQKTLLRDLHDGLSGSITAIGLNARYLTNRHGHSNSPDEEAQVLQSIRQLATLTNHEIRGLMNRIGNPAVTWEDLQKELHDFAQALLKPAAITLDWSSAPVPAELIHDMAAATCLTRLLKEALHNVARHSQATHASVHWQMSPHHLQVHIADNGIGITPGKSVGRGQQHMRSRAAELGGEIEWIQEDTSGLCLHLRLPLPLTLPHDSYSSD